MKEEIHFNKYLSELRKRVIAVAVFFIATMFVGIIFAKKMVLIFLNLNIPANVKLVTLNPYEGISLFIHFMLFAAVALTIPFAIYQISAYLRPAMAKKEKGLLISIPIISLVFFIIGASFGFFLTKNIIVPFLSNLALSIGISNNWSINYFVKFIVYLSLATGLIFQMPLVISLLVKFNILQPEQIKKARRYAIICLLILAAMITPPDIISLMILVIPLILLFEASVFISKLMKRGARV